MNSQQLDAMLASGSEEEQDHDLPEENTGRLRAESDARKRETLNELNENIANSNNIYQDDTPIDSNHGDSPEVEIPKDQEPASKASTEKPSEPPVTHDLVGTSTVVVPKIVHTPVGSEETTNNSKGTQTEEVTVYCGCAKCKGKLLDGSAMILVFHNNFLFCFFLSFLILIIYFSFSPFRTIWWTSKSNE